MTTEAPPTREEALAAVKNVGKRYATRRRALDDVAAERDAAILAALNTGAGVREVARAVGLDPMVVMRVKRRAEAES